MAQRNIKARYQVRGPQKVKVIERQSRMVKVEGSDMPVKEDKFVESEKEVFMVYFPQNHSIRVDLKELKRLGFHLKPRLVDMDTGEVIDFGGDPYEFVGETDSLDLQDDPNRNYSLSELMEDDEGKDLDDTETKASKKG